MNCAAASNEFNTCFHFKGAITYYHNGIIEIFLNQAKAVSILTVFPAGSPFPGSDVLREVKKKIWIKVYKPCNSLVNGAGEQAAVIPAEVLEFGQALRSSFMGRFMPGRTEVILAREFCARLKATYFI